MGITSQSSHIVITGASRGLGAALAIEAAAPAIRLTLTARKKSALKAVKDACVQKGAKVEIIELDLCDQNSIAKFYQAIGDAVDIFIANAGIFDGRSADDDLETQNSIQSLLQTNFVGTLQLCHAVAKGMKDRGAGQIVTISSLAGIAPLPDASIYSASKAGLSAYAEAMAGYLASYGVVVTDVRAGHIATEQTDVQKGGTHQMWSTQRAANKIMQGIRRKRRVVQFPWSLAVGAHLSRVLPWPIRRWAMASHRFYVEKKEEL